MTAVLAPALPAVRIGVIGAGIMGRKHAAFIAREETAELAAVADPFSDKLAAECGVPHFTDHRELLGSGLVDAVIVASPNPAHVGTALDCLAAGVPCLLEKPVATSVEEALELSRTAAQSPVPVLVGHHRRHHPAVRTARDLIAAGELGRLVAVNGMWMTKKDDAYFEQAWHREKGAGVLLINLVHDLDLLRHVCGEIVAVQARTSNRTRGHEVEDTAVVLLEFAGGALGSFTISDTVVAPWGWDQNTEDDPSYPFNPSVSCYSFAGTEGSLAFPQLAHYHHEGTSDWYHPLSLRFAARETQDSYTRQLRHFVDVVRGTAEPLVPVEDAARTLALVEAVQEAAATGTTVETRAAV